MNPNFSHISPLLRRNESISDDSSDDSIDDSKRLPFSNILRGKSVDKSLKESISDDSSSSNENSDKDEEVSDASPAAISQFKASSSEPIVKSSTAITPHPTKRTPYLVTANISATTRPVNRPIQRSPSSSSSQASSYSLQSASNLTKVSEPVVVRKRPRPINSMVPAMSDSSFHVNTMPSSSKISPPSFSKAQSFKKASMIQQTFEKEPASSSLSSQSNSRSKPSSLLAPKFPLQVAFTKAIPVVGNRTDNIKTNHVRFDADDDVASVISEEMFPFNYDAAPERNQTARTLTASLSRASNGVKVKHEDVDSEGYDNDDEPVYQPNNKKAIDIVTIDDDDDDDDDDHKTNIEKNQREPMPIEIRRHDESQKNQLSVKPSLFQPTPLRSLSMISPTSSKTTLKSNTSSLHDVESSTSWRERMWPTRAIQSFTRVLTRCVPITINGDGRRTKAKLEPNWDEKCFQRVDNKFTSVAAHNAAFFMMLVEECRESLCTEAVSEEISPIINIDPSNSTNSSTLNVEVVAMIHQSERGGLPQPYCDTRSCSVNTYRISIVPATSSSSSSSSSSSLSYQTVNSSDTINGDVVLLTGGSLDRPLLGIVQGWDPDHDVAYQQSSSRHRSNSFTGSTDDLSSSDNIMNEFINILVCVEDQAYTSSSSSYRPLGGWASAGMIYNGVQCSLSVIGNALTFIRESQALISLRHTATPLQEIILSGSSSFPSSSSSNQQTNLLLSDDVDYKLQCPQLWKELQKRYNYSQLRAIESIFTHSCHPEPSLSLLQGPPGTGKTHTILGIIAVLLSGVQLSDKRGLKVIAGVTLRSSSSALSSSSSSSSSLMSSIKKPRILVCAPSNTAVDELVYRLHTHGVLNVDGQRRDNLKVVRIGVPGGINRSTITSSSATPSSSSSSSENNHIIQVSEAHSLDRLVDEKRKLMTNEMKHHRSSGSSDRGWMSYMDLRKMILDEADIVCCTLSGAGSQPIVEVVLRLTGFKFDAVIIDEAAQATEPSALIPLKYDPKTVVLVGDPCQLPAVILSRINRDMNYQQSLFERMTSMKYAVLMLETQYRMHPIIAEYSSQRFYNGKLQTDTNLVTSHYHDQVYHHSSLFRPFMFHDVYYGHQVYSGTSVVNRAEADYIMLLFHELVSRYKHEVNMKSIGIIAPYSAQRALLNKIFREKYGKNHGVEISTVDGFQGREKDIIIFSCVRAPLAESSSLSLSSSSSSSPSTTTTSIGFLKERQRLNVAVTRAKFAVWMIGCRDTLSTDSEWNQLINYCTRIDTIITAQSDLTRKDGSNHHNKHNHNNSDKQKQQYHHSSLSSSTSRPQKYEQHRSSSYQAQPRQAYHHDQSQTKRQRHDNGPSELPINTHHSNVRYDDKGESRFPTAAYPTSDYGYNACRHDRNGRNQSYHRVGYKAPQPLPLGIPSHRSTSASNLPTELTVPYPRQSQSRSDTR